MVLRCIYVDVLPAGKSVPSPLETVAAVYHDTAPKMGAPALGVVPVRGQEFHGMVMALQAHIGKVLGDEGNPDDVLEYISDANGMTWQGGEIFEVATLSDLQKQVGEL